jgi:DNA adenine methylase
MKYMGSKNRIAKYLLPIILENRKENQYFVDVFCGGMNIIDKVDGYRIASDNNKYLIAMWQGILNGFEYPKEIDKSLYDVARNIYNRKETRKEYVARFSDDLIGWIGFMASANGRFFEGGYSGISITKNGSIRNYIEESIRNIEKQKKDLIDIVLECCDYTEVIIPNNSIIYCDAPYRNTKKYSTSKNFDYNKFWNWCREKAKQGHKIYISEYEAPNDFVCVWQKDVKSSLSANGITGGNKISVEKLFTYKK